MYESLSLGTQRSVRCPCQPVSVLSGLILEKIYEVFVQTNETVLNIRVSVLSGLILGEIYEVFVETNETVLNIRVSVLSECP